MSILEKYPIPRFSRGTWESGEIISRIGNGEIGGKASGLVLMNQEMLGDLKHEDYPEFEITIPRMVVLSVDVFDSFMELNNLRELALSQISDGALIQAFQHATIPPEYVGDLRDFIAQVHSPLAVRSSSLLEDTLTHPFAGVYATKMIPNNQPDVDRRFQHLVNALLCVYAAMYQKTARDYFNGTGLDQSKEKMAIIIQEVVGNRYEDKFYPTISGVTRSFNYYPCGSAVPTDGVVNLALGLGRQIVDGGRSWGYSPAYPSAPPPFNDVSDRMHSTQTNFWSVNMGTPPPPDPLGETEFLQRSDLAEAEADGVLDHLVSTYDGGSDRLRLGLCGRGPRVLDFGPMLVGETLPLNNLVTKLLPLAERTEGCPVEMEFAVDKNEDGKFRVCLLQMRPMVVPEGETRVSPVELKDSGVVLASNHALGHGVQDDICDIVYINPDTFDISKSRDIAWQVQKLNESLLSAKRPYMLIGFGRWGSADDWLGIPVDWGMISGARVIVESSFQSLNPDPSQGAHFFHNLISFGVFYFTIRGTGSGRIDWDWLERQPIVQETEYLKHVRLEVPLTIRADGLAGLGICIDGSK